MWKKHAFIDAEGYRETYQQSVRNPEEFWGKHGKRIDWFTPYSKVKNTSFAAPDVFIKWFEDGVTNVAHNCVDRHLEERGDQTAIIWEGDDPYYDKKISYRELHEQCVPAGQCAEEARGLKDRVTIYMPMIPEAPMRCWPRRGSAPFIRWCLAGSRRKRWPGGSRTARRISSSPPMRAKGRPAVPPRPIPTRRCGKPRSKAKVLVVRRTMRKCRGTASAISGITPRWPRSLDDCPPAKMKAEDPLFILYTSGSTGKPKGVLHTTGYLVYASMTHHYVFDYHDGDIYWCTADVGWVTGHSYIVYGPLANGATTLMFEGVPNYPDAGRFWQVVDKHKVNIFYTAPTAIRALMGAGDKLVTASSRKSLRLLGSVGEPINPEAWEWYHRVVATAAARSSTHGGRPRPAAS